MTPNTQENTPDYNGALELLGLATIMQHNNESEVKDLVKLIGLTKEKIEAIYNNNLPKSIQKYLDLKGILKQDFIDLIEFKENISRYSRFSTDSLINSYIETYDIRILSILINSRGVDGILDKLKESTPAGTEQFKMLERRNTMLCVEHGVFK